MGKRWPLVLAACALLCACASHAAATPGRVGGRVPSWTLPSAAGGKMTMRQFAGKPVYLNFFATWCEPCNEEAPYINALQKQYAPLGVRIIGIDEAESVAAARSFVKKFALVYPVVADDGTLEDAFLVNGLPVHVFVGRDGVIREITPGEMSKAQIDAAIHALL